MGAPRARRWKLLLPPFHSAKRKPPLPPPPPPVAVAPSPALGKEEEEEAVPEEFLCPISGAPMADPVIMPPGRTYERACVDACADLSLCPPGASAAAGAAVIPNDALKAAIRTWCARSGRSLPAPPSAEEAREAVLRAVPAARMTTVAAAATMVPARSSSNLSCSSRASAASTSSSGSSSEMATVEVPRAKEVAKLRVAESDEEKEKEVAVLRVAEAEEKEVTVLRVAEAEEEEVVMVVAKVVEKGDEDQVEAAMAVLLRETRESAERRRALCVPRLLAALRRVLHSKRHTPKAHADAAAALANLTNEPENRIPIVRAGAVLALVEVLSSSTTAASPEACEHAAGALFGLALHDENRAAIGVLGAVPPLLDLLTARDQAPRARRDAGMALYHLSLSAVNQSKLARAPAAAKNLLSIASDSTTTEPMPIRRLALMVICNLAKCAEGRAALMDTGAVAAVSAILSDDTHRSELEELCVAALYGMSRGNPRFRGLARAAGADRPLIIISERARAGAHKEMARKALRVVLGLGDDNEGDLPDCINNVNDGGGIAGSSVPVHRRRAASWAAAPPAPTPPNAHQCRSVCID